MSTLISTPATPLLQTSVTNLHNQSLEWLSATVLWKREVAFFQKLLDTYSPNFSALSDKKKIDHFQNIITYYGGELIDTFRKKIKDHEHKLADLLQQTNEADAEYFQEHITLIDELISFSKQFAELKHDFFSFIERGILPGTNN
jgi:hypothetical protein